jgi:hypothetical protein
MNDQDTSSNRVDRFHFAVGLVVLTASLFAGSLALGFLIR